MSMAKNNEDKVEILLDDNRKVMAHTPVIVSASRSTDIPAFYADWFFHRLRVGYSAWVNPFNNTKMYISYAKTRFIVFWSKNPQPLIEHLGELKERGIGCYIQYTLNDYEDERLERGVPPLSERIDTFKRLVDILGKGRVIWRFDPLILTDDINIDTLLKKIENIGDQLNGYTEKLVFSFADIASYRKVAGNLRANNIPYREWTEEQMAEFASKIVALNNNKGWNLKLATCGEKGRYPGVEPNHCIDDELIIKMGYYDKTLMDYLKAEIHPMPVRDIFSGEVVLPDNAIVLDDNHYATRGDNKDKGQRLFCGCMKSKDIGQYNTCPHLCEYCYANTSKEVALANWKTHLKNPKAESIVTIY